MSDVVEKPPLTGKGATSGVSFTAPAAATGEVAIVIRNANLWYAQSQALHDISMDIPARQATAFIGPSGCGKSTLLRCLNRMNDLIDNVKITGEFLVNGQDINARTTDVIEVRRRIGMVFQKSNPLPKSIFENVVYGLRIAGIRDKATLDAACERSLRGAALWDEVKDRLPSLGTKLSGGQQQRLTIARALSHDPEILCLDEFSIAIDPVTTMRIEDALKELKKEITIVLVTNLVQQARRLAGRTMFLMDGEVVEEGKTDTIFSDKPKNQKTFDYVNGIFG